MELKDKYAPISEKDKTENANKKILSDDAYALCEFLELLNKKIEQTRRDLMK